MHEEFIVTEILILNRVSEVVTKFEMKSKKLIKFITRHSVAH